MKSTVVALIALFAAAAVAPAVTPGQWKQSTEAEFATGKFTSAVVTSRGEVMLGREIKLLMPSEDAPAVVSALAVAGETIYAAAGNENVVYRIVGAKAASFVELPGTVVNSLLWTGKGLLAGVGGKSAGIYAIDAEARVKKLWSGPKVTYVWAIVAGPKGSLYAATGPEGTVYAIDAAGKGQPVYQAGKLAKNILCLMRSKAGLLYAGTDQQGLVIEIDPVKKTSRVLLDATENEVSALLPAEGGGLYAATSDAAKATPDGATDRNGAKTGKTPATKASKPPAKGAAKPGAKVKPAPGPKTKPGASTRPAAAARPPKPRAVKVKAGQTKSAPPATTKPSGPQAPAGRVPVRPPSPRSSSGPMVMRRTSGPPAGGRRIPSPPRAPSKRGNAVYFIQPNGLVRPIFRKPVTILAMLANNGKLLLGTGNGGVIYAVSTDGDEVAQIADTDAKQITALVAGPGGSVYFGTANKGSVGRMGRRFAKKGSFTAKALDARQIAKWGTIRVSAQPADGAKVTVATRSGNVAKPDEKTWSGWTAEMPVDGFVSLASPAGRFLQYRLTFTSNGEATAAVDGVHIIYQVGNLAPVVSAVTVQPTSKGKGGPPMPGPMIFRQVTIRATDPNGDKLKYILAFRQAGAEGWITITEKLTRPTYLWDTRTVGDGRYELRVTAADSPSNPPGEVLKTSRLSDAVVVDNTPPVVRDLVAKVQAGKVSLNGSAVDAGRIVALYYAVDSQKDWVAMLPTDGIADSDREKFDVRLTELKPGAHRIAVKVVDRFGNTGYAAVTVTLGK